MQEFKQKIAKEFGTLSNFADFLNVIHRQGMNPVSMLISWHPTVIWRRATGEPKFHSKNTVWICHDISTDTLFIRLHGDKTDKVESKLGIDTSWKEFCDSFRYDKTRVA